MASLSYFPTLEDKTLREIVVQSGFVVPVKNIWQPGQGVNNQPYFVDLEGTDRADLVIKVRPGLKAAPKPKPVPRHNPYWPAYTQALFGRYANGDLAALPAAAQQIADNGSLRTPQVFLADQSFERASASYLVSEHLTGTAIDWVGERRFTPKAARQLGRHLGQKHQNTGSGATFGIFGRRDDFAAAWWERFAEAYWFLMDRLSRRSKAVAALHPAMEDALRQAQSTGTRESFPLICIDQSPTHYLIADDSQGIAAMIDIEGHLWAPAAYELAMVEIWIGGGTDGVAERTALREGYAEASPYPAALLDVARPAYQLMTWMEWMNCNYTLLNNREEARGIVPELIRLCQPFNDATATALS